jgi:phosphate transport system ATP-binding protein
MLAHEVDPIEVRMRISMVFQKPNPFPKSIFENVAYGLRVRNEKSRSYIEDKVECRAEGRRAVGRGADRLNEGGSNLSGGQQQRLCIARGIATKPEVLLLRRALLGAGPDLHRQDRGADRRDQERLHGADRHAQHAAGGALSDYTAYMYLGDLIEFGADQRTSS